MICVLQIVQGLHDIIAVFVAEILQSVACLAERPLCQLAAWRRFVHIAASQEEQDPQQNCEKFQFLHEYLVNDYLRRHTPKILFLYCFRASFAGL